MALRRTLCALLLALAACSAAAATLPVEHSLDGGQSWTKAGDLTLTLSRHGSSAVLDRAPLTAEQQGALNKLVAGGGLYRLRLPSAGAGSPPVAASFPAHCLAAAVSDGGLALDLVDAGHVAGIALNARCGHSAAGAAANLQLPASQAVAVRLPAAAPEVLPQLVPGQVAADAAAGLSGASLQQDVAGGAAGAGGAPGQAAGEGRAAGQQGGGKGKPQPDERTWLQKNWMLVMPLGFIVLNILGNAAGPQGPQRPGAGGAPARAGAAQR